MPDDKKQHGKKGKSEAKEQRKPRQARTFTAPPEVEKRPEKQKVVEKPVNEEPGPEFYNNLKRETDDILKITEEANSKYKKKEILSNWSKYDLPIDSYDEIEEQESIGADYDKLIQAPLSIGGDFQFKHEKSWDLNTGPSPYDKYFDINMENLAVAISTVPFYERNGLDRTIFTEIDIANMDNRSTKYKAKYYNDKKKYSTPEMEAEEKITNLIRNDIKEKENEGKKVRDNQSNLIDPENRRSESDTKCHIEDLYLDDKTVTILDNSKNKDIDLGRVIGKEDLDDIDDLILEKVTSYVVDPANVQQEKPKKRLEQEADNKAPTVAEKSKSQAESPVDLEKWLDDFLDD